MTLALFVLIQYQSVTDRRTERQTQRRMDISAIAIPAHAWLAWAWAFWGRPPDSLLGLCFWIPLGNFHPPDSFASHHLTSNPEYATELGAAFSTPVIWCHVFHSRVFHPCYLVPRFPLPRFPPLSSGAAFSTPTFSTPAILMVPRFQSTRLTELSGEVEQIFYNPDALADSQPVQHQLPNIGCLQIGLSRV